MKNTVRYAIYTRKSSEGEDRQIQSIDAQLHELRQIAEKEGLKIIRTFKESKSAKAPFNRPDFAELIKLINAGTVNGILCWQINRLSRNPAESGMLQQLLQDHKIKRIRTSDGSYDPEDNAFIFSMQGTMANQFILDLRKNVKRGIAAKIRSGGISGLAMAGYLNERVEKTIYPDPDRFHLIRRAFDMYLTGEHSVPSVLDALNDWGYLTPKRKRIGGGPLSRSGLYNILRNPRYAGRIPDPYAPGEFVDEVSYQTMISPDEYDRVQELLGDKGCPRLTKSKRFALRGLIRCGECGCMITAEEHKKKLANGNVNIHRYYHCTQKRPCKQQGSVREQDLFEQIDNLLGEYELSPKLYEWGMDALAEMAEMEITTRSGLQDSQFLSIKEIEQQLDRLLDMAVKGLIDNQEYEDKSKILKLDLKNRYIEQKATADRTKNWYEYVGKTLDTLTNAGKKFMTGDLTDKAEILLAIGTQPVLLDRTLKITPNKWLIPIKENAKNINSELEKVRTAPDKIRKASEDAQKLTWYTR